MKGLGYLIFGVVVVGGYAWMNVTGTDPFAASTDRTMDIPVHGAAPAAAVGYGSTYLGRRRSSGYRLGK